MLFDLPNVIQEAAAAASDRLKLQAGDFFKDPVPAADAYMVMEVIHDWADEESRATCEFKAVGVALRRSRGGRQAGSSRCRSSSTAPRMMSPFTSCWK